MATLVAQILFRLIVAAILGGIIGLEREVKHKPAGLRTQMFICFGAAMFTILSDQLATAWGGDHTRIAAQIIPGIGFIGAGSILHARGSVSGLTTAATLFVVASIGMAVGGGLFIPAAFATLVLLIALSILGLMETRFNLKPLTVMYRVLGEATEKTITAVNQALEDEHQTMQSVQLNCGNGTPCIQFVISATQREQEALVRILRSKPGIHHVESLGSVEHE
jgi:putative Mg2+ transporter-C (MgtC) family protein